MNSSEINPFFSIIVPVYNVEPFIRECINSILTQTFNNFEIILVDDGSPDNCPSICDEYKIKDDRVVVIHKANGGLSDARNYGIKIAHGEYLVFVDSDDFLVNNHCLFDLFKYISKDFYSLYLLNNTVSTLNNYSTGKNYSCKKKVLLKNIIKNKYPRLCAWTWICKKNLFKENDLFFKKGILHEDEQWMPRLLLCVSNNSEIGIFNKGFYFYRLNREGAITFQIKTKNIIDKIEIIDELIMRGNELKCLERKFCYTRAAQILMSIFILAKKKLMENEDLKRDVFSRVVYLKKSQKLSHHLFFILIKLGLVK